VNAPSMDADYTPRYIRLARLLQGCIEDGTYPHGSLLPSSTRLAEAHTVSKATARHALEVLVKSGHARHIESKPHQVIWRQPGHAEGPRFPEITDYNESDSNLPVL
jgi:GntR family transcriptional regulator